MVWTEFWDMSSGGGQKEEFHYCYIEAPEEEAKVIFYNRFGHSPERVSCTCCGEDYSISQSETLEEATKYHRQKLTWDGCRTGGFMSIEDWILKIGSGVLFIAESDIKPEEREGELPKQGYVWVD